MADLFGGGGFGNFLGSQGLSTGLSSLGELGKFGTGIFGAYQNNNMLKSQQDLQNKQFGMQQTAFDRNIAREDAMANLDFTSGQL